TKFGSKSLFDGGFSENIQVGAQANETISVKIGSFRTTDMGTVASRDATAAKLTAANELGSLTIGEVVTPGFTTLTGSGTAFTSPTAGDTSTAVSVVIDGVTNSVSLPADDSATLEDVAAAISSFEGYSASVNDDGDLVIENANGDVGVTFGADLGLTNATSSNYSVSGSNNSFNISLDGGTTVVQIDIDAGNYTTIESLADNINQKIADKPGLRGEVRA